MLKKYFSRGRRQETGDRRQEKWEFRGSRSGRFVSRLFCPTMRLKYAPCMSVLD
ncbi:MULTISPECIES: hypothetical protein [Okeania]|uniref:hypothetical protein n=1 Tax=Okeania TaxID=1458928 RepID=UPI001374D26D|nr:MULTISPECIES: hypothetical protein [Okeania]NET20670.1 hypothetical protein [Okeania sp. SIO1H5]NET75663.1 hypothetical protein [Okeania sp. SIO1F9]NET93860.1 hypothetical protein [Okeania sp. SIO1H2]